MRKRGVVVKVMVVLLGVFVGVSFATPWIEISGLDGAEHWVWVEAETSTGQGSGQWKDSFGISGWNGNPDTWKLAFSDGTYVEWNFHAPADMSSSARLYLRMATNSVKENTLKIDGTNAGTIQDAEDTNGGGWTYPNDMTWADLNVTGISKGDHTLKFERSGLYADRSFDGFFIYDGEIDTSASDWNTTLSEGGTWSWRLIAPPHSADSPEITATSATITGIGLEEGMYLQITLDGNPYNSGDPIPLGQHELVVKVKKSGTTRVYAFAGANFTVVPEPTAISLIAIGLSAGFMRRK